MSVGLRAMREGQPDFTPGSRSVLHARATAALNQRGSGQVNDWQHAALGC
ncbi:hypothetical protein [Polaromonas sp. CG9_12]|nr:hypothetical protein [Polaromonas sp. CG9_12]